MIARRTSRGQSLLELVFAVTILVLVTGSVVALFVTVLQVEKRNIVRIRMAYDSADLHRQLRRYAAVGGVNNTVIDPSNVSVTFVDNSETSAVTRRLQYVDGDNNPVTIGDNRIEFVPNIAEPNNNQKVIRFVSPIADPTSAGANLPIFSRDGSFNQPLLVNFRIGDRRGDLVTRKSRAANSEAIEEDRWTGPGFQSILFRGAYGPRNVN